MRTRLYAGNICQKYLFGPYNETLADTTTKGWNGLGSTDNEKVTPHSPVLQTWTVAIGRSFLVADNSTND